MLAYIQCARHLVSCITAKPVDMATQVHVFVSGVNAGNKRFYLTRKTPSALEEAFAVALREDCSVTTLQPFDYSRPLTAEPEPEPVEVGAIQQHYGGRHLKMASQSSSMRGSRPIRCYRCRKSGHRAAVCCAPTPVVARVKFENDVAEPTKRRQPPSCASCTIFATTSGSDSRLIILSLHVEGAQRPIRALLDSGAMNRFVRADSLSVLPADVRIREGPGHMVVKYADGKTRRLPRRSATFAYEFGGLSGSDDFLVIELGGGGGPSTVSLGFRGSLATNLTSTG
ncbi:hypothetical protein PC123_g14625 [Phytophthora cactorum]|nr:hypothetical protein PC123_g14625 [Phytophthora cactorum]